MKKILAIIASVAIGIITVIAVCCRVSAEDAVLFEGAKSTDGAWGQAVSFQSVKNEEDGKGNTRIDPTVVTKDSVFRVTISDDTELPEDGRVPVELIYQSWTELGESRDRSLSWIQISAAKMEGRTIEFTGADIYATYPRDIPSTLDYIHFGDTGSPITITKVVLVNAGAPTMVITTPAPPETTTEAVTETTTTAVTEETTAASEVVTEDTEAVEAAAEVTEKKETTKKVTTKKEKETTVSETEATEETTAPTEEDEEGTRKIGSTIMLILLVICIGFMLVVAFFMIKKARNRYY